MNVHSLYVTRSKEERKYFHKLLEYTRQFSENYIKIVHLDFNWDDSISNIKFNNHRIIARVYTNFVYEEAVNI